MTIYAYIKTEALLIQRSQRYNHCNGTLPNNSQKIKTDF